MKDKLQAVQKGNGLFNVLEGRNLVRAKCSLEEVKNLFNSGNYYSLDYHYL